MTPESQLTATQQAQEGISRGVGLPNPSPAEVAAPTPSATDKIMGCVINLFDDGSPQYYDLRDKIEKYVQDLERERDAALRENAELLIRFNRNVERSDKDLAEIAELRGRLNIGGWSSLHTLQHRADTAEASLAALKAAMAETDKGLPDWPDPMDRWERSVDSWIRAEVYNKLRHSATAQIAALTEKLPCGHWARDHKNPDGTCAHCAMLLSYEQQGEELENVSAQLAEAQKNWLTNETTQQNCEAARKAT